MKRRTRTTLPNQQSATESNEDTVELTQILQATPAMVFSDLTTPARLLAWWGDPTVWWLTDVEVDLRVGGEFWLFWKNTDGKTGRMGGQYKLIEPGKRLVALFIGSHDQTADQLDIRLHPEDDHTRLMLRHSGLAGRPERYANYRKGWTLILSWLARHYSAAA